MSHYTIEQLEKEFDESVKRHSWQKGGLSDFDVEMILTILHHAFTAGQNDTLERVLERLNQYKDKGFELQTVIEYVEGKIRLLPLETHHEETK